MGKIKIGGKNRPFIFGTNASAILKDETGIGLQDLGNKLIEGGNDLGFIRDLFWACLQAGEYIEGEGKEINKYKVGQWIDQMDSIDEIKKAMDLVEEGMPKWTKAEKKKQAKKKKKKS